jgi:hypothetical protein
MRALLIDDNAKAAVKKVVDYAAAHPYYLPAAGIVPGDDPRYVAHLDTYRFVRGGCVVQNVQRLCCVFTFTHVKREVWRHLTISVPSQNYPNPFAAYTVAELFGFTGWDGKSYDPPNGWQVAVNKDEHCIVLAQLT